MVAKIKSGRNMKGILNYNENKVREGHAECIDEHLYGQDVKRLNFTAKLQGLENFTQRNRRATSKAVHISLNFHPTDKLNKELLKEIASAYMEKIGFGNQPYLVYQHFDAAHTHIHIVTTNIQKDGKRIVLYNIGRNQSEKARKAIEREYHLVKASGRKLDDKEAIQPVDLKKIVYGKSETKRSISNVVRTVVRMYKYTSLPELNAVLGQFNVLADKGEEGSRMFAGKGLLYRVIDGSGNKVGVPIKASAVYGKPMMTFLEKQFRLNVALRKPHKEGIKKCIDDAFGEKSALTKHAFVDALRSKGINAVFRQNDEGRIYGITFVDNNRKIVFKGSDLGKGYGAKAILERLRKTRVDESTSTYQHIDKSPNKDNDLTMDMGVEQLVTDLAKAENLDHLSPDAATKRKRKKKRKQRGL